MLRWSALGRTLPSGRAEIHYTWSRARSRLTGYFGPQRDQGPLGQSVHRVASRCEGLTLRFARVIVGE